jgi:F-type H+-transporting ATPase subunit b
MNVLRRHWTLTLFVVGVVVVVILGIQGEYEFWYDTNFWSGVAFFGFAYILLGVGAKPLSDSLRARQKGIEDKLRQAEEAQKVIRELRLKQEERHRKAKIEAVAMVEEAKRDAQRTRQEMLARTVHEIEQMKRRAARDIDLAKRKAIQDLADHATHLSFEIAEKTLTERLDAKSHGRLVSAALKAMAEPVGRES